jgi:peroxiredoxin
MPQRVTVNTLAKAVSLISICLYVSACSWLQPTYTSGLEGQPLPDFDLTLKDSTVSFHTASITTGKPFILLLYQPHCPYCRLQTADLIKNITDLKDIPIYFITSYPYSSIRRFSNNYHLDRYPNIIIARDSNDQVLTYFNQSPVPYMAFYDSQKRLKKVLVGKNDFNLIKKSIPN